jgi:hypothetical protein
MTSIAIFDTLQHEFPEPGQIHVGKATRIVGETATQFLLKTQLVQGQPFLIQTQKCMMKQGFQKASSPGSMKRMACDLVFSVHDSEFFDWIEKLESFCVDYLFQNQKLWFQTDLSVEDVENLFVSPFKIFKSSKTYQLRCHITDLGQSLKIFDAEKRPISYDETFQTDAPVVGILEVVGIRCSQKHFQIDIELKQLLQLPNKTREEEVACLIQGGPEQATSFAQGATTLAQGATTLAQEADTLAKGATTFTQEATTLAQGATTFTQEATTLAQGATTFTQGATTVAQGADTVAEGAALLLPEAALLLPEAALLLPEAALLLPEAQGLPVLPEAVQQVLQEASSSVHEADDDSGNVEETVSDEPYREVDDDNEDLPKDNDELYARVLEKAKMARDLGVLNYLESKKIGNTQLFLDKMGSSN